MLSFEVNKDVYKAEFSEAVQRWLKIAHYYLCQIDDVFAAICVSLFALPVVKYRIVRL